MIISARPIWRAIWIIYPSPLVEASSSAPLFDLLRPIPPLAWIPLMILWFGIGYSAKVAVIFLSAMIACVVNSYAGIKQTRGSMYAGITCSTSVTISQAASTASTLSDGGLHARHRKGGGQQAAPV